MHKCVVGEIVSDFVTMEKIARTLYIASVCVGNLPSETRDLSQTQQISLLSDYHEACGCYLGSGA